MSHSPQPQGPRPKHLTIRFLTSSLVLAALTVGPMQADILVTTEGERIETKGPWKIKGRQVLFTSTSGTLSAVRLSEVDLEASELATNPPPPPPPPPPVVENKERPKPVMVLTNDNIGRAEEIENFASAFGGALVEMQRAMAHGLAEITDDPEGTREDIDEELDGQQEEIEQSLQEFGEGLEEMAEVLTQVVEKYPALKDLDAEDPESVQRNAEDIRAAAADLRIASRDARSEQAREMLNDAASQMEAKLESQ